jgi:tight adherence protein C
MTPVESRDLMMLAGAGSLVLCGAGGLIMRTVQRQQLLQNRLRAVSAASDVATSRQGSLIVRAIASIGTAIARSGLLSTSTIADLERTLSIAGFRSGNGLGLFVGSKLLLAILLPILAILLRQQIHLPSLVGTVLPGAAAICGLLAPDVFVKRRRASHLRRLQRGLPDALDMMVICSEAGLGLEPAIERVAQEIAPAHLGVAEELKITASELRVVSDRRVALQAMGTRTGLESLRRLGTTLIQTLQYGTPLSQALRTLSAEMRQEQLNAFEARAARLPVLLTVPMILFILPTVFLIVAGPAALQVMHLTSHK